MFKNRIPFKKLRLLCAWVGGAALVLSSRISDDTFRIGVPFLILGEAVRVWALGFMEKKGGRLAVAGPYAFVRNPLYWGNLLLGLGVVLTCNAFWAYFVFAVGFFFIYAGTIKSEEKILTEAFGSAYTEYLAHVPRFWPKLKPWRSSSPDRFEWRRVWKHHEYITWAGILILIFGLYLYEELVIEGEFQTKQDWAFMAILICAVALILERIFRRRLRV